MEVNATGIMLTTMASTLAWLSKMNVTHNDDTSSSIRNNNNMTNLSAILWDYYDKIYGDTDYFLIVLYVPVMAIAVIANILVIAVVFKYHYMRSVTNYFVVNLSVADLLVTMICMPVAISHAISMAWKYSEFMCKLASYLQGVAVAASVFTITAMSIDRYLAIRSPITFRRIFNRKSTLLVILVLWLVALAIFAPVFAAMTVHSPTVGLNITFDGSWTDEGDGTQDDYPHDIPRRQLPPDVYICSEDFEPLGISAGLFGSVCFVLVYAIPGLLVILAYSMMGRTLCSRKPPFDCESTEGSASSQQSYRLVRERKRVAWMLLLLAVLFALCWLPYNVLRLLIDIGAVEVTLIKDALRYCLLLGHANSALNPVVYCFMTRNFRRSVSEILRSSYSLTRRNPRHESAIIDGADGSRCSVRGTRRGLLHQRRMVPGCNCGIPVDGRHTFLELRRTATSSSSYDSYCSRHSPHRHCYMLRSIRDVPHIRANPPENDVRKNQQQKQNNKKNNEL
ncbi:RYamide receptor-like [Linepithema humile]|uniref:RYamide receptor-like n=1 Tax=Linepithema humile TaxID=83485 RepID=UPI00062332EC|nr:PREDICTED: neuropeptide FF receptor 1-like [Linepithema humile]XP_012225819.1 PREDICTED: neuropeptide FF receptor 1-like [Linepithema humile]XP_012225820.1 PREDICTED: neuropeptide FF receptor 1-like [Linepithema humile]XP_012225821.1 PREDICTED: neuropeptide FF receptor 1-like [Linepithema humile]